MWITCFVSDLRDSSIVYYRCLMALEQVFLGRAGRKGVSWFFQPPPFNTVTVQSVFKKQNKKKQLWTSYMLFAIFVWQAMFMWVVGAVYLSNCEFIPLYRCNMYRKSVCCRANLSYTDFTPSECWVILFYIYIFILIFVIKMLWEQREREKKESKRKRHTASFPLCSCAYLSHSVFSFFFPWDLFIGGR